MTSESTNALHEQKPERIAAFFDIDGTLLPSPSLERRFVSSLLRTGQLSPSSLLLWLVRAIRLVPRSADALRHANKMYLRGAQPEATVAAPTWSGASSSFFPSALDRLAWHASNGHAVILVSGTLNILAQHVASALEEQLRQRGLIVAVSVCATRLEELDGHWTGRIIDEPIAGRAKARAALRIAQEAGLDLTRSFAYGDSSSDRWLLAAVGYPVAVNPSRHLARVAALHSWPVLRWGSDESLQRRGGARRRTEEPDSKTLSETWECNG